VYLTHSSLGRNTTFFTINLDVREKELEEDVIAAYIGTSSSERREPDKFFLLVIKANNGTFQRIGIARVMVEHDMYREVIDAGKPTWLPGRVPSDSYNAWGQGTITLV
jgi:hypothetical protein